MKTIYVIAGGTMVHVAPHFSLCAPAYGSVGTQLRGELEWVKPQTHQIVLLQTQMCRPTERDEDEQIQVYAAAGIERLETNDDLSKLVDHLIADPNTGGIVMAAAVCDWGPSLARRDDGTLIESFGKDAPRLNSGGGDLMLNMKPTAKILNRIRKTRKDIFLVGFKATTGLDEQQQYIRGLELLKENSCNLVLANDLVNRRNMVIVPEEARYHVTEDRHAALRGLAEMTLARANLRFTRSEVRGQVPKIEWEDSNIPANLRTVVDHLVERGAYKPFRGKTAGHFAARTKDPNIFITSERGTNFNKIADNGMVMVEAIGDDRVISYGGKPSVGGQSQRIIFSDHPDVDCIVHFHCEPHDEIIRDGKLSLHSQINLECGSHECGQNTSNGLRIAPDYPGVKAVMLDNHGPNICFSRNTPADTVIQFIDDHFDLSRKTGGSVELIAV